MKYLAYFRPNEDLSHLILKKDNVVLPNSGLHCTLCVFYMSPTREDRLVNDLSQISFHPFEIETVGFDDFNKDSLVLKLARSDELLRLHKEIVAIVRNYADADFDMVAKKYFGNNYNAHLTISKSFSDFDRTSKELIGQKDSIVSYSLAKKVDVSYKELREFYSSR
jgi:hypothetical protein